MDLSGLNDMQLEAVMHTEGALLILAGAGSGKTRVLTHRIAQMIENGVPPYNILAITFTNKAAREMKERISQLIANGDEIWVSTFHSACVRILRREIDALGYDRSFTIYDTDDADKLMKQILKDLNVNDKMYPAKSCLYEIGNAKDELISPEQYASSVAGDYRKLVFAKVYEAYQKRLRNSNALDFDDIIFKTVELFAKFPEILAKYQNRFKYISVDEYQDTNYAQYELVRLLSDKYKNLCVVGDDDQSIYGWRGADIRNILDFEKDYKQARVIKLEQNYRSTKTILDTANAVISNNKMRKSKRLWTELDDGLPVRIYAAHSDADEAYFVAGEIAKKAVRGRRRGDFAVLYRTNAQSRVLEDQFVKQNIPYRIFGGLRFYQRKEVKDALAYLRTAANPFDDLALRRIINYPKRGIGDSTVDKLSEYAAGMELSLSAALADSAQIIANAAKSKKIIELHELLEKYRQLSKTTPVGELVKALLDAVGLISAISAEKDEDSSDRAANVDELINKAFEFEKNAEQPYLAEFLEEIALVADIDGLNEADDTVTLMTIHSAKGLEFPTVFVTGFEEGLFPGMMSIMSPEAEKLEEERRLCYVAVTRAMKELYITHAHERRKHGEINYNMPSRFLKEIPSRYTETVNAEGRSIWQKNKLEDERPAFGKRFDYVKNSGVVKIVPPSAKAPAEIDYAAGDSVSHIKYGVGAVTDIRKSGADFEVAVEFPAVGIKRFMASVAKLVKV